MQQLPAANIANKASVLSKIDKVSIKKIHQRVTEADSGQMKNLRDEVHSISVVFDTLLPVFGEIPQHFQRHHTDGDVILVRPDLHSNEHHTRMQLIFEDLPLKKRQNDGQGSISSRGETMDVNFNQCTGGPTRGCSTLGKRRNSGGQRHTQNGANTSAANAGWQI